MARLLLVISRDLKWVAGLLLVHALAAQGLRQGEVIDRVPVPGHPEQTYALYVPLHYTPGSGRAPRRSGTSHSAIAPYGPFRAGNGTEIVVGIQNEREWAAFCAVVLRRPDLTDDARFASGAPGEASTGKGQTPRRRDRPVARCQPLTTFDRPWS